MKSQAIWVLWDQFSCCLNKIYPKNVATESEESMEFYKQLKNKIWKDGYKMKNEYFNWVMTLFNNPKGVLKGFKQIDFMDKIASFWRFLPKNLLKQTLSKYIDQGIKEGNIETLILTGFDDRCHEVLQSYVDLYGDFQTPALIACFYMKYVKEKDPRMTKWIMEYRKYLSKLRLWNIRCNFDISRMALINRFKDDKSYESEIESQFKKYEHTIFCPLPMCETNIGIAHNTEEEKHAIAVNGTSAPRGILRAAWNPAAQFPRYVPHCKCTHQINWSVCSLPMYRINPTFKPNFTQKLKGQIVREVRSEPSMYNHNIKNKSLSQDDLKLELSDWFSWCNSWKHVGHLEHVEEWFSRNIDCPIPDCQCQCKLQCPI